MASVGKYTTSMISPAKYRIFSMFKAERFENWLKRPRCRRLKAKQAADLSFALNVLREDRRERKNSQLPAPDGMRIVEPR